MAEQFALGCCRRHCASLKALLHGPGKLSFHFTFPVFCLCLVEVRVGRSMCMCVTEALFVPQSVKEVFQPCVALKHSASLCQYKRS